jgi:uncharacterized protein YdeI (YjbR/CyaY-like superfamily)
VRTGREAAVTAGDLPVELFRTVRDWDRWLTKHGASAGVWMRIAKKAASLKSINYAEALDVALCHGWIDSQKKSFDDESFLQKFTPRGDRSIWSKVNREKVEALSAAGLMKPAGVRAVERARRNGRWDQAYDPHSRSEVPPDLAAALARNRQARQFFDTLTGANRYAVLFRIQTAVRPETRARRIEQFVAMLARGETFHGPPKTTKRASARKRP